MKVTTALGLAARYFQCGLGLAQWPSSTTSVRSELPVVNSVKGVKGSSITCKGSGVTKGRPSSSFEISCAKGYERISAMACCGSLASNLDGMYILTGSHTQKEQEVSVEKLLNSRSKKWWKTRPN